MSTRPNILLITCHDTGRHVGCYGVETVQTPAIDGLAADGYRFTNVFAASPVCSPSRGAMLTGRYPQSNGLIGLTQPPWGWSLHSGERHLSHILRDAGYHTALFGLQHEASDTARLGFAARYGESSPSGGREPAREVASTVASFLERAPTLQAPFFAQVGFFETHRPFDFGGATPDDGKGVFVPPYLVANEAARTQLAQLQGAIRQADAAVGTITSALERTGLAQDTIVIVTADHGIEFPRSKWFLYDPGIEVALVARWPGGGIAGGRTSDWLLSNVDLLPTLLELVGVPVPVGVQGRSFAGAFAVEAASPPRDAVFGLFTGGANESRCVRTDRHKLIRTFTPRRRHEVPVDVANVAQRQPCPVVELFDLAQDPNEFTDVADDPAYAAVRGDLNARLWAWLEEVEDPILRGPMPTPTYRAAIAEYRAMRRQT